MLPALGVPRIRRALLQHSELYGGSGSLRWVQGPNPRPKLEPAPGPGHEVDSHRETAWPRLLACSLVKIRLMWFFTVFSEM